MKTITIGNSSGFWGDDPLAMKRQLAEGQLDYLIADYLAEVSMSILRKQQNKQPDKGYVQDFIDHIKIALEEINHSRTKIITNAGGNNPVQCAIEVDKLLKEKGIERKIMAITGDNILQQVDQLYMEGISFQNTEDGRSFSQISNKIQSANVYTGSQTLAMALDKGADIIIAGRVADSSLTVGAAQHEFSWKWNDWDKLSSAMIAGHILECGAQASGGNFTDWKKIEKWDEMGFPIVEMFENGDFTVSRFSGTGGLVNQFTVKEQLVYEIADPTNYLGPDVISDITSIELREEGENKVKVSGAKGKAAPPTWKISMAYHAGYKCSGSLILSGPDALEKAELVRDVFWRRVDRKFEKQFTNFIGYNACHQNLAKEIEPNEILIQFNAFDHDPNKLEVFARSLSAMILSAPPGIAVTGGRPKIQEVLRYWPALIHKHLVKSTLYQIKNQEPVAAGEYVPEARKTDQTSISSNSKKNNHFPLREYDHSRFVKVKLKEICLARSGDKGNMVNIGVIARTEAIYEWIKTELTVQNMREWFHSLCEGEIRKYELDNLMALNFTLEKALDGGGTYSGRIDPQGKTFASAFLAIEMSVPREIIPKKSLEKQLNQ